MFKQSKLDLNNTKSIHIEQAVGGEVNFSRSTYTGNAFGFIATFLVYLLD